MKHVISGSVVVIIGLHIWVCVASVREIEQLARPTRVFIGC